MSLILLWAGACDGGGCEADGFRAEPFPVEHADKTVPVSGEVRITSHGLLFMSGQVENLIGSFTDDGLSFCIPPTVDSDFSLCHQDTQCDDGSPGCQLTLSIDDASILPGAPNRLLVDIVIGDLYESLPVSASVPLIGTRHCWLDIYSKSGGVDVPAQVPANLAVAFNVDTFSPFQDIRIDLEDVIVDVDDVDFRLRNRGGSGCSTLGWLIDVIGLDSMLVDMIEEQLDEVIDDLTRSQLCQTCEDGDPPCPNNATCDASDDPPVCMYNGSDQCVPMLLGIEGVLEPDGLIGDMVSGSASDVYLTGRVADRAVADTGLTLGLRVGSEPEAVTNCAPVDPTQRPAFAAIDPSPSMNQDVKPNGSPFHFGFALHRRTLQHITWSLWASGALCLALDSTDVEFLNTGAVGALVPAIRDVAPQTSSMRLVISPQTPPDVHFGANLVSGSEVEEGLMIVDWKDLDIHMYAFVFERYARLFTLRVDVELPVAVAVEDGGLLPVLGDVEDAIRNLRVINDELVAADTQMLEELLPTLLGFALPQLLESLSDPIDLPEFFGYELVIGDGDLRGIDNNQYLGLFATLEFVGFDPNQLRVLREVDVVYHEVTMDHSGLVPRAELRVNLELWDGPEASEATGADVLYRLNGGAWQVAGQGSVVGIRDGVLSLQGHHTLELKARRAGEEKFRYMSRPLAVRVDFEPPRLSAWAEGHLVRVEAEDLVDPLEALELRYRIVIDGVKEAWSGWQMVEDLELSEVPVGSFQVKIEVRDQSGHVAQETVAVRSQGLEADVEPGTPVADGGCGGCAATTGSPAGAIFLLLMAGLVWIRRRRRGTGRGAAVLLIGLAMMISTGCRDSETGATTCDVECGDFQTCEAGACVDIACEGDSDCEAGICEGGACVEGCRAASDCDLECPMGQQATCDGTTCACEDFCADGCGENQFCCYTSDSCQNYPNPCAGVVCEAGFQAAVTERGTPDHDACEVAGATCECLSLPPLPKLYFGPYPSMAEGGGVIAAAAYNVGYGDLMVGILDNSLEPEWYFVDGVPESGSITGALDGPRGGIAAAGPNVGSHTATAVDDDGVVHVFYRADTGSALRYTRGQESGGEWTWEITTVESAGNTGYETNVALVDGTLHVFYVSRQAEGLSELRHRAIPTSMALSAMADTDVTVLHSGTRTVEGREDVRPVVAFGLQLTYSDGEFFLSFFDNVAQRPAYLIGDGDSFGAVNHVELPVGPYVSAARDNDGGVHWAYMDQNPNGPRLTYRDAAGATSTLASGVRHTLSGTSRTEVGHDVRLFFVDGAPQVVYHDASTHELVHLALDGTWSREVLAGVAGQESPAHGFFPRVLELNDGRRAVMDFMVDTTGEENFGNPTFRFVD